MAPSVHPAKKRRVSDRDVRAPPDEKAPPIVDAKGLQAALADYADSGAGLRRFREFLHRCSDGPEVDGAVATRNRESLREYLETQCKHAPKEDEDAEGELESYRDITQTWRWASQQNSLSTLSLVPATLAILLRLCSSHEELKSYGRTLVKVLISPGILKVVYRNLTSTRDHVVSPCLRMLTEMNRFDHGALCPAVHSAFDFTVKDLTRNLDPPRGVGKGEVEDPTKPSVRTLCVRFILSFFQHGSPAIKGDILGLRGWMTPLFRSLRTDAPPLVNDLLEVLGRNVLADMDIPRATKTTVFNEWALGQIAQLYSRDEVVKLSRAGKEEEKTVSQIAHEFLTMACTNPGLGICFQDHGWYPRGSTDGEEKRKSSPQVFNRTLSFFVANTRPYADTLQLDLLVSIFSTSPELVANYFSNSSLSFEPKLTSTWIGYCTFLSETIALPVPENFGAAQLETVPPPVHIIMENILPKPLGKTVLAQCLTNKNSLIRFLSTRLLIVAFQKLEKVITAMDAAAAAFHDPRELWIKCKLEVVGEFCRRVPDIGVVTGLLGKADSGGGILHAEATTRLLAEYYVTLPEVALAGKFDPTIALSKFLGTEDKGRWKGMGALEARHLLRVAKEVPDVKWWSKPASMIYSPFVMILKYCCDSPSSAPLEQIRSLLSFFVSTGHLFQTETAASTLEALLESLYYITESVLLDTILPFLDQVVSYCSRLPFKYFDSYAELLSDTIREFPASNDLPPVSPFVMTIVEQWKFFVQSVTVTGDLKLGAAGWLSRFLQSCALVGENRYVLSRLCGQLAESSGNDPVMQKMFTDLKSTVVLETILELCHEEGTDQSEEEEDDREVLRASGVRTIFPDLLHLSLKNVRGFTARARRNKLEAGILDLVIVQRALVYVAQSTKIDDEMANEAIVELSELLHVLLQVSTSKPDQVDAIKRFLASKGPCLDLFLNVSLENADCSVILRLSKEYANLLSLVFDERDVVMLESRQRLVESIRRFVQHNYLPESREVLEEALLVCRLTMPMVLTVEDVQQLIRVASSKYDHDSRGPYAGLLHTLLQLLVSRKWSIDVGLFKSIWILNGLPESIYSALAQYLLYCPAEQLYEIWKAISNDSFQLHDERVDSCSGRAEALFEACSLPVQGRQQYTWKPAVDDKTKTLLERILAFSGAEEIDGIPDKSQISVLRYAASLLPSSGIPASLQQIVQDKKRSNLTASTVALADTFADSSVDMESREMKAWFLMVFDHLTRRFAEDSVLSDKTKAFAQQLGNFLGHRKINIATIIPRAVLNATLEAAFQNHVQVAQVMYLAARVVSSCSAKALDVAKLLQMLLGQPNNPLAQRDRSSQIEDIQKHTVYLLRKLFAAGGASLFNISTLDSVLCLYHGTNDIIDATLLDMIAETEAHLARSCASRITQWSVVESTGGKPFVANYHGKLSITVDARTLARSVFQLPPLVDRLSSEQTADLDLFLDATKHQHPALGTTYDPRFLLPVLMYCLVSAETQDAQAAVERHCVSYAIACLASLSPSVRRMAISYLGTAVNKLEDSAYRGKLQVVHLLCALLASWKSRPSQDQALPATIAVFLAQAAGVLANPAHFLYERIMQMLLRRPFLALDDLPLLLGLLDVGDADAQREVAWIVNILTSGLKTEADLLLFRKRALFSKVLNLYAAPSTAPRTREKVLELLWNAASVPGGATTLITRHAVLAWIQQQIAASAPHGETRTLQRLRARLYQACARAHVRKWSMGGVGVSFVDSVDGAAVVVSGPASR